MVKPSEKLAESLEALQSLQARGQMAIRSRDLGRTDRERLCRAGFLQKVIKGWYIPTRPDESRGESAAWYASFWPFCAAYLTHRFGTEWALAPEQSLALWSGNRTAPRQLLVRAPKGKNNVIQLPHGVSLLDIKTSIPAENDIETQEGLRLYALPAALVASAPSFFRERPIDARAALAMAPDASELLSLLLKGGHGSIAGRLAGAFRNIGRNRIADEIVETMRVAGYSVRESDPFAAPAPLVLSNRERSPWVNRLHLLWQTMREEVLERFPTSPDLPVEPQAYLKRVEDIYATDAYHSLSIEGYQVDPQLIERVRSGNWNPDDDPADRERRNALAARGYWQAFLRVKESVTKVLEGAGPGLVVDADHGAWYRELFAPGVTAGMLRPADLAGYRTSPVYIRRSRYIPPSPSAIRDAMPFFFDLLRDEPEPAVRVVLGHFIFVYLHPYIDGNGRIGRFLMNVMLAAGGWPWLVIPVEKRDRYMMALEEASVRENISPFTDFLAELLEKESAQG